MPFETNLLDCKFVGKGRNGVVYQLPDNKIIKICNDIKSFYRECYVLQKVNGNKYFPRIYDIGGNYMIRDYVDGECLKDYIQKKGLSRDIAIKVAEMLEEFEVLNFTKIDIRCKDIYVQRDGSLKIIDPKKCFSKDRSFPSHLSKGFNRLGVLPFFLKVLKEEKPLLYSRWSDDIESYIKELEAEKKTSQCKP